jgi:Fuc2NAc and GlcNAc transferase
VVPGFGPLTIALTAGCLSASAAGVGFSIRLAKNWGAIDFPNERSSHEIPTPRMGGVPMAVVALLTMGAWVILSGVDLLSSRGLFQAFLFCIGMLLLGFLDDLYGLSPLVRILVQFACATLCLWAVGDPAPKITFFGSLIPGSLVHLAGLFWAVWMVNLYNFMDGIDGLAGGEAAVASSFFFLLFARFSEPGWAMANLFVAAASMGFLVHNWPPARVFMGDAGSGFLGAFYGLQAVLAPLNTPIPLLVLLLPFANFILDTTFTLFRRLVRREKWYLAHRSHVYQRMTGLGMSHRKVTLLELSAQVLSCTVAAMTLTLSPRWSAVLVFTLLGGLMFTGLWVSRMEAIRRLP